MNNNLLSGRVECPKCNRKGLGYANHPHALGRKDFTRAQCKFCNTKFKITTDKKD